MEKILISACLLGDKVRYNAEIKACNDDLVKQWNDEGRFIKVCPEVSGGLPTPRPPAEYQQTSERVITVENVDVTKAFVIGAHTALALCQKHDIKFAILKESSPSCGSSTIYDGSFSNQKVSGEGITTKLLREHGVQVFSENNLEDLKRHLEREN